MNTVQRLLKNTIALSATSFLRLGVGLALTVYIARALGPAFLGKYALLIAYINIFQLLAEAGIPRLVTREVARQPGQTSRFFWNALAVQIGCSLAASVVMILVVELLHYPADTRLMLYLATGSLPAYAVLAAGNAILQAYERMEFNTLAEVVSSVGQLVATILLLQAGYGVVGLAVVKVLGFALVALVNLLAVWRLRMVGRPQWDLRFGWQLLRHGSNLLLMAVFGAILLRLDVLILTQLWGEAVTGIYNAAYQLVKAFVLLVWAYADAIYPVLSRFFRQARQEMLGAVAVSLQYGMLLILPLAIGGSVLAEPVIRLIYGDGGYVASAWALRLLVWHLWPFFVHTLLVRAIIAADRQDLASRIEGLVLLVAVACELVLIRFWGMIGAALAANLIFVIAVGVSSRALTHVVGPLKIPWGRIGRLAGAGVGMGIALWLLRGVPLWVSILLGAALYAGLALGLGGISARDRQLLARMARWVRAT